MARKSSRKYTTKAQDAAFIARLLEDSSRGWKVGDVAATFHGTNSSTVVKVEGETVYLADGTYGHRSRMRRAEPSAKLADSKAAWERVNRLSWPADIFR